MPDSRVKNNNIFSHIEFPDYEFRPYPKLLYAADGATTKVADEKEEEAWYAKQAKAAGLAESAITGTVAVANVSASLGKSPGADAKR